MANRCLQRHRIAEEIVHNKPLAYLGRQLSITKRSSGEVLSVMYQNNHSPEKTALVWHFCHFQFCTKQICVCSSWHSHSKNVT